MTWLVCDYGEVLSTPQPASDRASLVAAGGADETAFWTSYWRHRPPYDAADVSAAKYWAAVVGPRIAHSRLDRLVALDVASWLHPNRATLDAAGRASLRGYRLAILSNAPPDVADALDRVPWLDGFETRLFSCRLRLVKPDPRVFHRAIDLLGAPPDDIIYFDDREDNVAAARAVGIRASHFTDASQLDALPNPG